MSKRAWTIILVCLAIYLCALAVPLFDDHAADYRNCLIQSYLMDHGRMPDTDARSIARLKSMYHDACDATHGENNFFYFLMALYVTAFVLGVSAIVHGALNRRNRHKVILDAIGHIVSTEINMGDVYKGISNSTIINRSELNNSIVNSQGTDPALARAIADLAKFVADSNNDAAEKAFNGMTTEIAKRTPEKSTVRTYWDIIRSVLPAVKDVLDITVGMEGFLR